MKILEKMTCKNASVVDYAIVSTDLFRDIAAFAMLLSHIGEFASEYSEYEYMF